MMKSYTLRYGPAICVAVSALLLYAHTIGHSYNLDDGLLRATHIKESGWKRYAAFFTRPYFERSTGQSYGYRPIVLLSYEIEKSIWGQDPRVSHLVSVLLYGLACALLYVLLRRLFEASGQGIAMATALLFVSHPLHTEVVSSIKNRDELLAFVGFLCSFLAYIRYAKRGGSAWIWGFLAAALALLSKKSALVPLLLIPLGLLMSGLPLTSSRMRWICVGLLGWLVVFSPMEVRKSLWLCMLCVGGWWMGYAFLRPAGSSYKPQQIGYTVLTALWITGLWYPMYGCLFLLVGVGALVLSEVWRKESTYFECFFFLAVSAAAYVYASRELMLLLGGYSICGLEEIRRGAQDRSIARLRVERWARWGALLVVVVLLLVISGYSSLAIFQLSVLLSLGIGLYIPKSRPWVLGWLLLLPLMGYLYNESLDSWIGVPGAVYLYLSVGWKKSLRKALGWLLCVGIAVVVFEQYAAQLDTSTLDSIEASSAFSTKEGNNTNLWLTQREGRRLHTTENPLASSDSLLDRLVAAAYTYGRYSRLHLLPYPLRVYYGYGVWTGGKVWSVWVWVSLLFHLLCLALAWWLRRRDAQLSFALLFYGLCLLPFSNLWVWVAGGMAERLAFGASLGFVWAMAYLIWRWIPGQWYRVSVIGAVCVAYGVMSYQRSVLWKDRERLYVNDLSYTPRSAKLHQLLSMVYLEKAQGASTYQPILLDRAERHLKTSFHIHPGVPDHWFTLGVIEQSQNKLAEAIEWYKKVLVNIPEHADARFNLASCQEALGIYDEAVSNYQQYIRKNPKIETAYANLAFLYFKRKDYESALEVGRETRRRFPHSRHTWLNLGRIHLAKRDTASALASFRKAEAMSDQDRRLSAYLLHLGTKFSGKSP